MMKRRNVILICLLAVLVTVSLPTVIFVAGFYLGSEEDHIDILTNRLWSYLGLRLMANLVMGFLLSVAFSGTLWLVNKTVLEREKVDTLKFASIYFTVWTILSLLFIAVFNLA